MRIDDIKSEIEKLDLSGKLILIEDVWDNIAKANSEIPLPQWQREELDKRLVSYKTGETQTKEWTEIHAQLRDKYT